MKTTTAITRNSPKKFIRTAQALRVLQLLMGGMKKADALREVKITESQYSYWLEKSEPALQMLQQAMAQSEITRLNNIANTEAVLLNKLIEHVQTMPLMYPLEAITIIKFLHETKHELEAKRGIHTASTKADQYVFKGPNLNYQSSVGNTTKVEISRDGSVNVTVDNSSPEVIDIVPSDGIDPVV